MLLMHGGHHVAQNSTTYGLPSWNPLTSSPFTHLSTLIDGAALPTFSVGSAGALGWASPGCLAAGVLLSLGPECSANAMPAHELRTAAASHRRFIMDVPRGKECVLSAKSRES